MTPKRKQRLMLAIVVVAGVTVAVTLALNAFNENLMFFYTPADVKAGKAPTDHPFRVGGLVVDGSVRREEGSIIVQFDLTDNADVVTVSYDKILPDLFREGQGIVALGRLDTHGVFVADEVLAKHDENYMPPEVAAALSEAHEKKAGFPVPTND